MLIRIFYEGLFYEIGLPQCPGGANQRGGLPRLSMEWAHRVSSDAVCRSICSERSQGSAPHQRDASRTFDIRKRGGRLPPRT